jgi:hypothetical protein
MGVTFIPPNKQTDTWALDCDGDPHRLDIGDYTPSRTAVTFVDIYLNVDSFTLKDPAKPGRLRVFMRRAATATEPIDDTFFYDLWLPRQGWSSLDTRGMFEKSEAGRPLRWYYQVNGCTALAVDTRFIKYCQIW